VESTCHAGTAAASFDILRSVNIRTGNISEDLRELYFAARSAASHAYVPYSEFRVGAAVRSVTGEVFTGCNVENASYGLTICAERVALTTAVACGAREFDVIAIHVEGPNGQPCGACRQFMREFSADMQVAYLRNGELTVSTIADLLPDSFHPAHLA
jgi:cytidine deaminase